MDILGLIIVIVVFLVLHLFDKWLIGRGAKRPFMYAITCMALILASVIIYHIFKNVHSEFLEKIDIPDIFGGRSLEDYSVGATLSHYLVFLFAFIYVPHIKSITWEDTDYDILYISKKKSDNGYGWKTNEFYYSDENGSVGGTIGAGSVYDLDSGEEQNDSTWDYGKIDRLKSKFDTKKEDKDGTTYSREVKKRGAIWGLAIKMLLVAILYFMFTEFMFDSHDVDFIHSFASAIVLGVPLCLVQYGIRKWINKTIAKKAKKN